MGKGKLQELVDLNAKLHFDTLIADDELNPAQQRTLEQAFSEKVKVIDRTALILDVFAKHATTREGRLQVELAQSEYLLPRLAGQWSHLERLGGGIGTRGPGETQIETDRRLVTRRINNLRSELEKVRVQRARYRDRRHKSGMPTISLVGYTNAGKSSLLKILADDSIVARNQLFSTLDPVTRRVRLPSGINILVTDTVGFIRKLPPSLIAAFRATLEEVTDANLIVHVLDISHRNAPEHVEVVQSILKDLNADLKPQLLILNKSDLVGTNPLPKIPQDLGTSPSLFTSTATGAGIPELLDLLDSQFASR